MKTLKTEIVVVEISGGPGPTPGPLPGFAPTVDAPTYVRTTVAAGSFFHGEANYYFLNIYKYPLGSHTSFAKIA